MSRTGKCGITARPGFTLLEAIVAMTIISLVAVATLAEVGAQLRSTDHAKRTTEAVALAEDRLANIRVLSAADLQSLPDSVAGGRFPPPLDSYVWHTTVQPFADQTGLNVVTVQIEWPGGAYTLTSRIYQALPVTDVTPLSTPLGGQGQGGGGQVNLGVSAGMSFGGGR